MALRYLGIAFALLVVHLVTASVAKAGQTAHRHTVNCIDLSKSRSMPTSVECAILARKSLASLSPGPIVWRLETYPSITAARKAESGNSIAISAGSKSWLMTLGKRGERTPGASFVAEVGPLPIPRKPHLELLVANATFRNGITRGHVHPGPEAWYVLSGAQCVETPDRKKTATAGQSMFEPAEVPMQLVSIGPSIRSALFILVYDASVPWTAPSTWRPKGLCGS